MIPGAVPRLLVTCLPILLAACGATAGTPTPAASEPSSPGLVPTAEQLCQLLTPEDWTAAGLSDARAPLIDDDGPGSGSAYCVFNEAPYESGGLELDVFVSPTTDEAAYIFGQFAQSIPRSSTADLSGVDDALINTNIQPGFGAILARAGRLVVTITLPATSDTAEQLTSLAALVLSRAQHLR